MGLTLAELLTRAVDRIRFPLTRAQELAELRRRFALACEPSRLSALQVARAQSLRALREAMATALGAAMACTGCARGHALPEGRWAGGFCCSGRTEDIFDDAEVAALRAAGIQGKDLSAPRGDHAGCAFRGRAGCSLPPGQRPSRCLQYVCSSLRRELGGAGRLAGIQRLAEALETTQREFATELVAQDELSEDYLA